MSGQAIVRVLRALRALESGRHTYDSLADVLACTPRQARRYVNALEEAHVPIRSVGGGAGRGVHPRIVWIERHTVASRPNGVTA